MASAESPPSPRRFHVWLLAIACFVAIVGARTAYVHHFGSDLPTWDQWDSESERLLLRYEQGRLRIIDLFEPHNEHRIVATKLLALGLYLANGQWDARLECTANAVMVATFAVIFLFVGRRLLDRRWHLPWLAAVLAVFAAPMSWQNVLGGFHTQQTFLIGLSFAAIALLTTRPSLSGRWWAGVACGAAALFTMGSGLLATAAAAATLVLTLPLRQVFRRHGFTLAVCSVIVVVGLSLHTPVAHHDPLKAHSVGDFVLCFWRSLQWPLLAIPLYALISWLPWGALAWRVRRGGESASPGERIVVGSGVWVLLQYAASAYARGADGAWPADRYFDTVGFGIAVNVLALLVLLSHVPLSGWRAQLRTSLALVGVVLLAHGWWSHISRMIYETGPYLRAEHIDREFHTRAFIYTGDISYLKEGHIPHPSAAVLHHQLTQEEIRRILPASVRLPVQMPGMASGSDGFTPAGLPSEYARPPGWPILGSYGTSRAGEVGTWASEPLPRAQFRYWAIPTITPAPGSGGLRLELTDGTARRRIDLAHGEDARIPGAAWRMAVVPAPRGPAHLLAEDANPLAWMAFAAPVEMATGSYWAWRLGGAGMVLFWGGVGACALAGFGMCGRDGWRSVLPGWVRRSYGVLPRPLAATGGLLSAAVGGALAFTLVDPREPAFFVATIRGELNGKSVELFFDRGRGIRAADSAQAWFHEETQELALRLPMPAGTYRALRFDPMDYGATTVLESPRIEDARGNVLRLLQPAAFAPGPDLASVHADGTQVIIVATPAGADPQLHLKLDAPLSTQPGSQGRLRQWLALAIAGLLSALLVPPLLLSIPRGARAARAAVFSLRDFDWKAWLAHSWRSLREARPHNPVAVALVLAAVIATVAVRETDSLVNPQLWADDASLFFIQADSLGIASLLQPYNGYLHTVPRLLAYVGVHVDPGVLPATYVWLSGAMILLAAVHTLSPRIDLPFKPLLALAIAAVPHTGEVFLNVANTQWLVAIVLLQMAIKADGVTPRQRLADLVILAVAGLTGPFSILFLPFFAWRAWRRRTTASIGVLITVSVCAAIQVMFIAQLPGTAPQTGSGDVEMATLLGVAGRRLVFSVVAGPWKPAGDSRWLVAAMAAGFLAALFALSLRRHPLRETKLVFWLAGAILMVSAWHRARFELWDYNDTLNGDRYFFLPKILLCWLLLIEARSATWIGWTCRALLVVGFAANLATFRVPPLPDYHWHEHCDAMRRGEKVNIPITPAGWIFQYPGRPH